MGSCTASRVRQGAHRGRRIVIHRYSDDIVMGLLSAWPVRTRATGTKLGQPARRAMSAMTMALWRCSRNIDMIMAIVQFYQKSVVRSRVTASPQTVPVHACRCADRRPPWCRTSAQRAAARCRSTSDCASRARATASPETPVRRAQRSDSDAVSTQTPADESGRRVTGTSSAASTSCWRCSRRNATPSMPRCAATARCPTRPSRCSMFGMSPAEGRSVRASQLPRRMRSTGQGRRHAPAPCAVRRQRTRPLAGLPRALCHATTFRSPLKECPSHSVH